MPVHMCRVTHAMSSSPPCYVKAGKGAVHLSSSGLGRGGRGARQSFSERLVPMLLQEMMMSEVEASSELDLVGGHQQYRNCTEPAKRHSLLC